MAIENENLNPEKPPMTNHKSHIRNKSTGPRTAAGKRRSRHNALKHGLYSNADFFWDAAVALGEDPREYGHLLEGLIEARRPADALEMALVEEIALLFWKKMHLERTELAIQVCNLQKHDLERRKLFVEVGQQISNTAQSEMREKGLRTSLDAPGKFEQTLAILNLLAEMVDENDFSSSFQDGLHTLYGAEPTLRGVGMLHTYLKLTKLQPGGQEFEDAKTLMRVRLAEEAKDVLEHYELFLHEHVESTRAARLAATAPSHAQWAIIIRQENALHRQLERKIRLLMEIQDARKRAEQEFLDKFEASLHRKPPGGRGGGQGGALGATRLLAPTQAGGPAAPHEKPGVAHTSRCPWAGCMRRHERGRDMPNYGTSAPPVRRCGKARDSKNMLNRRNELKVLVETKELSNDARSKRTPFGAPRAAFRAKKCAFSTRISDFEGAVTLGRRRLLGAA
jgi:hypothetical protein